MPYKIVKLYGYISSIVYSQCQVLHFFLCTSILQTLQHCTKHLLGLIILSKHRERPTCNHKSLTRNKETEKQRDAAKILSGPKNSHLMVWIKVLASHWTSHRNPRESQPYGHYNIIGINWETPFSTSPFFVYWNTMRTQRCPAQVTAREQRTSLAFPHNIKLL